MIAQAQCPKGDAEREEHEVLKDVKTMDVRVSLRSWGRATPGARLYRYNFDI